MLTSLLITLLALVLLAVTVLGFAGNGLILLLALIYAIATGFVTLTGKILWWMLAIYLIGEIWEFGVSFLGIKREKVDNFTLFFIAVGTVLGSIIGTIIMPLLGSILGASIGSFVFAFIAQRLRGESKYRSWYIACVAASMQLLALFGKIIAGCILFIILIMNLAW